MYKVIVVGVDASARSTKALDQAVALAKLTGAELHIVCAYVPLDERDVFARGRGLPPREVANVGEDYDVMQVASDALDRAKEHGVDAKRHLIAGQAADALLRVASELPADLLVVGNRGMTGVRHVLGSVPNRITHHASCSVLVVDTRD